MKSKAALRLGFVFSDLHCGSTVGLLPPRFKTLEGQLVTQNYFQQWLWECWTDAMLWVSSVAGKDPFFVVLNGDLMEGMHHRTTQVISPDMGDHVEAAIHCLRDLTGKASKTFVVKGTECHTGNAETVVGKALKLEINDETSLPSWDRLAIDIQGIRFITRHHMPTTTRRSLSATQLSVQLAEEQLNAVNAGEPLPRVLAMAHRHLSGSFEDDNGMSLVTGAWQGLTRHGHKVVPSAKSNPTVAALDFRNCAVGELPKLHTRKYLAPKTKAISL